MKREKARQIVQSKYLNNQVNRPSENNSFYEQKVPLNYQKKTVNYNTPLDTSYRSSNIGNFGENYQKSPFDTFENIVNKHAQPKVISRLNLSSGNNMEIIGKKISKKKGKKSETNENGDDPNTIEISNKEGPETFTITHKT